MNGLSEIPLSDHTSAELGIIYISAVQITYLIPYLLEPIRKILSQPVFKDPADRTVQTHDSHSRTQRSMIRSCLQNIGNLVVIQTRNDGSVHNAHGYSGLCQALNGL